MMTRAEIEDRARSHEGRAVGYDGPLMNSAARAVDLLGDAASAMEVGAYRAAVSLIQNALQFAVDAFEFECEAKAHRMAASGLADALRDGEES